MKTGVKTLPRRTLLRGALAGGTVALALPPLEAMFSNKGALAQPSDLGPIFGIFYWANGMPWHAGHGTQQAQGNHPDLWTPQNIGAGYTPSQLNQVDLCRGA